MLQEKLERARQELNQVIVGQQSTTDALFVVLLTGGHALLIGVPGLAKTLIVNSLAKLINGSFNRVQFTPDLMPADITGMDLVQHNIQSGQNEFHFMKGPIFCNILLADEINRTPPKTQSALLQAMQELKVSQGDKTFFIEKPFFVLATQNPIEQEGTYPLPEAQLDRFTFSLQIDYPSFADEMRIAILQDAFTRMLTPILSCEELVNAQKIVQAVPIGEKIVEYIVRINFATRQGSEYSTESVNKFIAWGGGPRASQFMVLAAKAHAFLQKRNCVSIEDVDFVAPLVLQHRLVMNFQGEAEGISIHQIIQEILDKRK